MNPVRPSLSVQLIIFNVRKTKMNTKCIKYIYV